MTLKEVKTLIESIAKKQPNINTIVESGDVFELNTKGDVKYSAFCLTQRNPHRDMGDFRYFNFWLFYVDRLMADKSNKIAVQSTGIEVLSNIINTLKDIDEVELDGNTEYTTFTQRFSSECAGAYASITIAIPISFCVDEF